MRGERASWSAPLSSGVGALQLAKLASRPSLARCGLMLDLRNRGGGDGGRLNHGCGADAVQKERRGHPGFQVSPGKCICGPAIAFAARQSKMRPDI